MKTACIVVAAGSGQRLGESEPKALVPVAGRPILWHALRNIAAVDDIQVVIVAPQSHLAACVAIAQDALAVQEPTVVAGGATRRASVAQGLLMVAPETETVLVHDAARCFTPPALTQRVIDAIGNGHLSVVPVLDVADTIRDGQGNVVDRSGLHRCQTPQGFQHRVLRHAHRSFSDQEVTDDVALVQAMGVNPTLVPGDERAFKITHPWDLVIAEHMAAHQEMTNS